MSHYYDTPSRAEGQLPSNLSANEDHHSLTEPREPRGFLLKVYALMYGAGLAWIAALIAAGATFVRFLIALSLKLSWAAVSAIGSTPEQPNLQLGEAGLTLAISIGLTTLALLLSRSVLRMINHGPVLPTR